jgi:Protein of unknown function (DUF4236)
MASPLSRRRSGNDRAGDRGGRGVRLLPRPALGLTTIIGASRSEWRDNLPMGFLRFRYRIGIAPWLRLNVSKSGLSTSVGRRGLWFTIGHGKTRETVGLPGTGVSYTEQQRIGASPDDDPPAHASGGSRALIWLVLLMLVVVAFAILR